MHQAADGGLARVRLPGGALPAAALAVLGAAAAELGNGVLELTSRANVQVRGLRPGVEAELVARLRAVGLLPSETHERVRNIIATPLTGRHLNGHIDVRGLVRELDKHLCADPALAALPGRFLFTVDDGAADVSALEGDVGLLALAPRTSRCCSAGPTRACACPRSDGRGRARRGPRVPRRAGRAGLVRLARWPSSRTARPGSPRASGPRCPRSRTAPSRLPN